MPLIELLMGALKAMLKSGTELPLNRSGAAGWVWDGSAWFVAKRLADAVRAWIKLNAPDESLPGENKNDRLFDTWQEYGCIQVNPASGQAVWYVTVHGQSDAASGQAGEEGAGYCHNLSVLRFPLTRLFDDEAQFPPAMAGRIEVRDKRPAKEHEAGAVDGEIAGSAEQAPDSAQNARHKTETAREPSSASTGPDDRPAQVKAGANHGKPKPAATARLVREPSFNKPRTAADSARPLQPAAKSAGPGKRPDAAAAVAAPAAAAPVETISIGTGGVDGFEAATDDDWLDDDDDGKVAVERQASTAAAPKGDRAAPREAVARQAAAPMRKTQETAARPARKHQTAPIAQAPGPLVEGAAVIRPLLAQTEQLPAQDARPEPVLLLPKLPALPHDATARQAAASQMALDFMRWLQQGLASREIKYNEAGAPVHFTEQGMALVSPLIFKRYARENGPEAQADAFGLQIQREVIKAGWHRMNPAKGSGRVNILRYAVLGRGGAQVGKLSAVVLANPERWVMPVPPANPVLELSEQAGTTPA